MSPMLVVDDALIDADVEKASTRAAVDSSDATNCNFMVRLKIGCVEEKICGHRQCPSRARVRKHIITILQAHTYTYVCMYRVCRTIKRGAAGRRSRRHNHSNQANQCHKIQTIDPIKQHEVVEFSPYWRPCVSPPHGLSLDPNLPHRCQAKDSLSVANERDADRRRCLCRRPGESARDGERHAWSHGVCRRGGLSSEGTVVVSRCHDGARHRAINHHSNG